MAAKAPEYKMAFGRKETNMKTFSTLFLALWSVLASAQHKQSALVLTNPLASANTRLVNLSACAGQVPHGQTLYLRRGAQRIPVESIRLADGSVHWLAMVDLAPLEQATYTLYRVAALSTKVPALPKRTQAEIWTRVTGKMKEGIYHGGGNFVRFDSIRVPDGFNDHAYFIKYEGPGWESDKVGYRMYLDWRNAVDVFGKRVPEPVLQQVGVDGYETYHHLAPWGMDVLKVGKALGVGSIARLDAQDQAVRVEKTDSVFCSIFDGNLISQVVTRYYGYLHQGTRCNLTSVKTIEAGSRLTRESLHFSTPVNRVCTGIIADSKAEVFTLQSAHGKYHALATWGNQSLNNDALGLAILCADQFNPVFTRDKLNHLVHFNVETANLEYYFLAAWQLEPQGIATLDAFKNYLQHELDALEQPIVVEKQPLK